MRVTLHEGKYHQVKRMIAACGATVTFLKRVQLGGVRLDESLAPGEFRELTEEELGAAAAGRPVKKKAETGVCRKNRQKFLNIFVQKNAETCDIMS